MSPLLATHIAAATVSVLTGYVAMASGKGTAVHRRVGLWFTGAMAVMGASGAIITMTTGVGSGIGGILVLYLVVTGLTTVRPLSGQRTLDVVCLVVAVLFGVACLWDGMTVVREFGGVRRGVPAGMIFFLGTIAFLAAIGDIRVMQSGITRGAKRIARHLWRMTFALFMATGSFFLGQADEFPESLRIWPALWVLALAPLVMLAYWMWRVRLKRSVQGLVVRAAPTSP